jgi:hypothetical protein
MELTVMLNAAFGVEFVYHTGHAAKFVKTEVSDVSRFAPSFTDDLSELDDHN